MNLSIQNFREDITYQEADITCTDKSQYLDSIIACSIVVFENLIDLPLKIKFEWKSFQEELTKDDFLFVEETQTLFFASIYQWGAIDTVSKELKRHESGEGISIRCETIYILIISELYAESCRLNGDRIDNVPIDLPWESEEYEDRIEFQSIVFGHQILKTK